MYLDKNNKHQINYFYNDLKLIKMATKKATIDETIIVVEGDYFSATYNRKKIRGIVENLGDDDRPEFRLQNSQGAGEELDCPENAGEEFSHYIEVGYGILGTIDDLKEVGVTNYVVLKDKGQKAIIDKDKLPVLDTGNGDWAVKVSGQSLIFGCGRVELTRKQIEGYLRFRENIPENLEDLKQNALEDCYVAEIESYLAYLKKIEGVKGDGALYNQVISACSKEIEEDDINNIPEADIKALFKYMDWINSK